MSKFSIITTAEEKLKEALFVAKGNSVVTLSDALVIMRIAVGDYDKEIKKRINEAINF